MYTTREAQRSPVFNNMMYPYRDWQNTDYQLQYMIDDDTDDTVITKTIKNISNKNVKNRRLTVTKDDANVIIYKYNDEGYPLDDPDDMYMEPLKYYGKGFNCKTMSPTKD